MKIWTAIAASFLVAAVESIFLVLGIRYLPIIETVVFLISLVAYIKLADLPSKANYIAWSALFLILTVIAVSLVDLLLSKTASNLYGELNNAGIILVDFVAGALFGFTYRFILKSVARKRALEKR